MEIIDALEPARRGLYGGALGYLDLRGNLDFCIAIRTLLLPRRHGHAAGGRGHRGRLRSGGGAARDGGQGGGAAGGARALAGDGCCHAVLLVDNYDSFTYNLYQYLGELGAETRVVRNDEMTVAEALALAPDAHRDLARPGHSRRGRHQPRPHPRAAGRGAAARRVPRPPGAGPGVRRHASCARRGSCTARRRRSTTTAAAVFAGPAAALHRHALPLAGGRARRRARLPRGLGLDGRRHRSWASATASTPLEGVQFHPESILTTRGQGPAAQLPRQRGAPRVKAVPRRRSWRGERARAKTRRRTPWPSIMDGEATPAQIGALLGAIAVRGETEDEVVGFARAMRAARRRACARRAPSTPAAPAATARAPSTSPPWPRWWSPPAACRSPSTATARPAAAAAAPTCWRRWACASTPRVEAVQRCLDEAGWAFLFAPAFHASTRHAVGPRRELGVRTAFNLLGPLTNPALPEAQVVGVPRPELDRVHGRAASRAWACAAPGSSTAPGSTRSRCARPRRVTAFDGRRGCARSRSRPPDAGLAPCDARGARGRRRRRERRASRASCWTARPGPARDVVVLNAAAALLVAGRARRPARRACERPRRAIDDGAREVAPASACEEIADA